MDYGPTVRGRRLIRELIRLRQAEGLSLETAAQRLDFSIQINAHILPGFLQTPDYARAVIAATRLALDDSEVERRVNARIVRRDALSERDEPPEIHVVLDEAALRRRVGGPEVMATQLGALTATSEQPHLTLQVLPFSAGRTRAWQNREKAGPCVRLSE